ncbi:MAG TPA: vanadium-dependent haloperoxidase [Steroidobacteraceae bacterium]|nr:vanadium-dependent haloperoxidase [Steroidobacteraceae bacterium]
MIRKLAGFDTGAFLLLRRQGVGATIRSATLTLIVALLAANPLLVSAATPDPVLEWIDVMNTTVLAAGTAPNVTSRVVALVSASVFDAVNGIEPRFRPLQVRPDAPHHASQSAAAIQAAYVILLHLYPAQSGTLTTRLNASLTALTATEKAESIAAGVAWGQKVADAMWTSRLTDGFTPPPPPFLGAPNVGVWRPTPPANASGATPQIATMTPWVLTRPSQFRLPPPLALDSQEYAADLNEVKVMGTLSGSMRTSDQSELALFWALNTPLAWNRITAQISAGRGLTLTENAHLFALLNLTLSDALIACWDSKYRYVYWRPITAIRAGLTPADADPTWEPWLDFFKSGTPAHPEYPSAHSSMSGAAAFILAAAFGENTGFSVTSEVRPGTTRSFHNFSDATAEIADARVFGGIHFRTSCLRANALGRAVADYVSRHAMRPRGDDRDDEED